MHTQDMLVTTRTMLAEGHDHVGEPLQVAAIMTKATRA
jgi:hypothetical protein